MKPTPSSMNGDSRPRTAARRCRCRRSRQGTSAACSCRCRCARRCRRTRPARCRRVTSSTALQHVVGARAERVQHALLERVVLLVGELERLADVVDRDRRRERRGRSPAAGVGGAVVVVTVDLARRIPGAACTWTRVGAAAARPRDFTTRRRRCEVALTRCSARPRATRSGAPLRCPRDAGRHDSAAAASWRGRGCWRASLARHEPRRAPRRARARRGDRARTARASRSSVLPPGALAIDDFGCLPHELDARASCARPASRCCSGHLLRRARGERCSSSAPTRWCAGRSRTSTGSPREHGAARRRARPTRRCPRRPAPERGRSARVGPPRRRPASRSAAAPITPRCSRWWAQRARDGRAPSSASCRRSSASRPRRRRVESRDAGARRVVLEPARSRDRGRASRAGPDRRLAAAAAAPQRLRPAQPGALSRCQDRMRVVEHRRRWRALCATLRRGARCAAGEEARRAQSRTAGARCRTARVLDCAPARDLLARRADAGGPAPLAVHALGDGGALRVAVGAGAASEPQPGSTASACWSASCSPSSRAAYPDLDDDLSSARGLLDWLHVPVGALRARFPPRLLPRSRRARERRAASRRARAAASGSTSPATSPPSWASAKPRGSSSPRSTARRFRCCRFVRPGAAAVAPGPPVHGPCRRARRASRST